MDNVTARQTIERKLEVLQKLNEWFAAGVFSTEEIQIILKMIDDAPFAGVALAQSVQG